MKNKGDEVQIKSLFKYKGLSRYMGIEGEIPIVGGYTFIGLEVELENISKDNVENLSKSTWTSVVDGSLKNKGREFVTIPIRFRYLEVELKRLFSGLISPVTSSRCSVHVHINVRDMTTDELASFIVLYSIFERALYRFSGDRWDSNFCVPIQASPSYPCRLLQSLKLTPHNTQIVWYKYMGFNVCPIFGLDGSDRIGTIEFRHLKGTMDINLIINWINLIISLKIAAKTTSLSYLERILLQMNSDSSYTTLAESVFGGLSPLILEQPTFKRDIETCITSTKKILLPPSKTEEIIIDIPKGHKLCVA